MDEGIGIVENTSGRRKERKAMEEWSICRRWSKLFVCKHCKATIGTQLTWIHGERDKGQEERKGQGAGGTRGTRSRRNKRDKGQDERDGQGPGGTRGRGATLV